MRKLLILISLSILVSSNLISQNPYDKGFQKGYEDGFCYGDFACISPIPPVTPIPLIGDNPSSYQDGYKRGFKTGLENRSKKETKKTGYQASQADFIDYTAASSQTTRQRLEEAKIKKLEQTKAFIEQTRSYYNSFSNYPEKISTGWHEVVATNNYDFFDIRKVYIENNLIKTYVIDDYLKKNILSGGNITKGKALVKIEGNDEVIEIFFINFITDSCSSSSPPQKTGKVSFWSTSKRGKSGIAINKEVGGILEQYFAKDATPVCGQNGTLTLEYKVGTYPYIVINEKGQSWQGSLVIKENSCNLIKVEQ